MWGLSTPQKTQSCVHWGLKRLLWLPLGHALAAAPLICGLIGVVAWFAGVDFYHRHFFDAGPIVAADNVVRVVFVAIFSR
jgi:hypothetical protein